MAAPTLEGKLVVAISSRALFDLTESHRVYTERGVETYHRYQIEHEDELLEPGPAFALVTKLLRLNRPAKQYVEVILLSRNSADTGLRVFNSIKHYGLDITRAAFTKGESTSRYVPAFGAHLFLSADTGDVRRALEDGYAAATIFPSVFRNETDELRIAFDGDAVLFSDEAERIYQAAGLTAFAQSERTLPTVSAPSRVVRSIMLIAVSIAHAFAVVLIERVPSDAARASQPTWSTPDRPCSQEVSAWLVRRETPRSSRAWAVSSCALRVVVLTVTR